MLRRDKSCSQVDAVGWLETPPEEISSKEKESSAASISLSSSFSKALRLVLGVEAEPAAPPSDDSEID